MNQTPPTDPDHPKEQRPLWKLFAAAQGAAAAGTAVDFLFTIFLTEVLHIWYVTATAIGSAAGAITNFLMGRYWVFQSTEKKMHQQAFRYALVSLGSLILNTSGVYLLTEFMSFNYIISKIVIAIFVAVTYNFILQKNYVFK